MKHSIKYSPQEKVKIWLDLCDFTFRAMKSSLGKDELEKRLSRMREKEMAGHRAFLSRLGEAQR